MRAIVAPAPTCGGPGEKREHTSRFSPDPGRPRPMLRSFAREKLQPGCPVQHVQRDDPRVMLDQLVALVVPPRGAACRARGGRPADVLCGACRRALPWLTDGACCERCALPLPHIGP